MILNETDRKEVVKYRLENARTTLTEVPIWKKSFTKRQPTGCIMRATTQQVPYSSMTVTKLIRTVE